MPTPKPKRNKRSRSSCPDGWRAAGYSVPIHLTVSQQRYCRRAIGINRFVYNLCVATHRFCRTNRMPWPSWQDLYKVFNACKHEDYPFATTVASRVAEGAFMDFGTAIKNWRDTDHKAGPPRFHKKCHTGTGSFRAASSISQIKYNGKRRIQIPGLGSVKPRHTLPKGLVYEAHIKFLNGQWVVSIKMWQPPKPEQKPNNRIAHGAVDTGINPHATDSEGQVWESPKAYYQAELKLRRWQRAQARRTTGSRGCWEAQRRSNNLNRRIVGLRRNAQHQMTATLVHKFRNLVIEDLNVAGIMQGKIPKAQADAGMGEIQAADHLQGPVASLRSNAGPPLLSIEQDLLQLPDREHETQAGTELAMQQLRHRTRPKHQRSGQPAQLVDTPCRQWGNAPRREGSGRWSNHR